MMFHDQDSGSIQFQLSQQQEMDNQHISLPKWKLMTSSSVRFIDRKVRNNSQTINYSLSWLHLKWIDPQTYQWQ